MVSCFVGGLALVVVSAATTAPAAAQPDVAKSVLGTDGAGPNLLKPDAWRGWQAGFERDGESFVCNNGADTGVQRGASQTVVLNQTVPEPIVATAESKAEGVTGSPDSGYSVYLDLVYADGTSLWGQTANFSTATHDWQRRRVVVLPEKPVKTLAMHLLLRGHGGKATFRNPELRVVKTSDGAVLFDGVPAVLRGEPREGFQVRDVAAGSDYVHLDREALGLKLQWTSAARDGVTTVDATLSDRTGKDRAITLLYAVPVPAKGLRWLDDPRRSVSVEDRREYLSANRFGAGSGRLSRYPLAAVARDGEGMGLGIDMAHPAFYRLGYNAGSGELFLAYDLALTPERPAARVRFVRFTFDAGWDFRSALAQYYDVFPERFRCRTPEQGLWMPFAKISEVRGWEDFGFRFKEGNNETRWDDEHGIVTFRYTEPMTWWMRMPAEMPRTIEAAGAEAARLAEHGDARAKALSASGFRDPEGRLVARFRDTPWCNGAAWSMNSMPGLSGEATDFANKWNPAIRERLYGPGRTGDLDGEYIDSSEGYMTAELDFCRDHFAAAGTPLTFSPQDHRPGIFRGLVVFEYVRAIADDVHGMDKLMMANGAPTRLCWLCPLLDVLGTETNWHRDGRWRPMSDADMLYRRSMCRGKPYCFLMNTRFEEFSPELVERYMKRCLAYGMFPGFFSHNASQGQYFKRPELYDRDRPLFKRYIPLVKRVAQAGWQPITRARCDDEHVYVERFGDRYLTVLNDSPTQRTATITIEGPAPSACRELVTGRSLDWDGNRLRLALKAEDVAVLAW